jgi:hypothetical protein
LLDVALEYVEETMKEWLALLESTYSLGVFNRLRLGHAIGMGEQFYTK